MIATSILVFAAGASAQEETRGAILPQVPVASPTGMFGQRGRLAISNDLGLLFSNTSLSGGGGSTSQIQLRPAADYFLIDNLSLGAFLGFNWQHATGGHSTEFLIGPRVGYDIPISDMFSAWARVGFSYRTVDTSVGNNHAFTLNLSVPLLVHVQHFFFGFGPALDVDLSGDQKATTIAGRITFGGWM